MLTKEQILKDCKVEGNIVYLPSIQLERGLYLEVKNSLELIGGKWKGGKIQGFVFTENPADLLTEITTGKIKNIKKDFQFFATPSHLADKLVELAQLEEYDLVLEPSAGQGAIIKAIQRVFIGLVHYCELMPLNRSFLDKIENTTYLVDNFLKLGRCKTTTGVFDKIIANPPFSKNQDIDHVRQMYECLKPGGRIVTIVGTHWECSINKKEVSFKNWINSLDADIIPIEAGEFKESGTNIKTNILVINKPNNKLNH